MTSFFAEDTCALKDDPSIIGVVDVDSEIFIDLDELISHDGVSWELQEQFLLQRRLPPGHVLVIFIEPYHGCSLVPESALILVDRGLAVGDVVKRHPSDAQSGTVTRTAVECTLQPIYNGLPFNESQPWPYREEDNLLFRVSGEELRFIEDCTEGDYIIYRDWIGEVRDIFEEVAVRLANGSVVVVESADELDILQPSNEESDIHNTWNLAKILKQRHKLTLHGNIATETVPASSYYPGQTVVTKKANLRRGQWKFGTYDPSVNPEGIVVDVRVVQIEVTWLTANVFELDRAPNPTPSTLLDLDDIESGEIQLYDREKMPMDRPDMKLPGAVRGSNIAAGDHVRFRDVAGAAVKYAGQLTTDGLQKGLFRRIPRTATQGYDMNVFIVKETKLMTTVQWQDGSISDQDSSTISPYLNVDDHDVWPGEIVALKKNKSVEDVDSEIIHVDAPDAPDFIKPKRVGVVQSTDARERLARIRWFSNPDVGIFDEQRSILLPGSSLGELSRDETQVSFYEIVAYPALSKRRGDLVLVAPNTQLLATHSTLALQQASSNSAIVPATLQAMFGTATSALGNVISSGGQSIRSIPNDGSAGITWFGEIVDLGLDGLITVRLGAAKEVRDIKVSIDRIIVIVGGDDESQFGAFSSDDEEEEPDSWDDSMSIESSKGYTSDDVIEEVVEYEGGERLDGDGGDEMWMTDEEDNETQPAASVNRPMSVTDAEPTETKTSEQLTEDDLRYTYPNAPAQFLILESPPPSDHHFLVDSVELSASLMRRVRKEHSIMKSSLPNGIWVRTWIDRLDLLRILIVGPRGTPYELAPFVMDFHFNKDFPDSPPEAYFHSWTNGVGRINPNLYEDGKICLSLLGTWPGDRKNEGWSAKGSSMLQVLVSLMGLVLVKEPYYNEAGFNALIGTEESRINSALYSERALVMAKGFVAHALSREVNGLDDVIRWLYLSKEDEGPKLLPIVVGESNALLKGGDALQTETSDSLSNGDKTTIRNEGRMHLSSGAKMLLRKHLANLEKHLVRQP
ncbi:MAG: hypothetical protein Q9187_002841 [Circinaria calcarea]